jgi:putative Holliday junction resolvase
LLATPLEVISSKDPSLIANIRVLIEEYEPVKLYVGLPKMLSGADSTAVDKANAFAEKLTNHFDIEITMIDERLSTVSAARSLREAGVDAKSAKPKIDSVAAVAILEQGLSIDKR